MILSSLLWYLSQYVLRLTEGKWSVTVKTSADQDSGTSAQVSLIGFGTRGQSQKQPLGSGQQDQSEFRPGAVSEFNVSITADLIHLTIL